MALSLEQKQFLKRALLFAVLIRVLFLGSIYLTDRVILMEYLSPFEHLLHRSLIQWDAKFYMRLAQTGYSIQGMDYTLFVFFPLYPYLVKALSWVFQNILYAALFLSFICSVGAGFFFQDLMRHEGFSEQQILKGFLLFCFFPTSIHMILPYTESLFLLLTLFCFWSASQDRWGRVGLAGLLASATRINGLILIPSLGFEAWKQKAWKKGTALLLVPLGFCFYLGLNWYYLGSPFAFTRIQTQIFRHEFVWPWEHVGYVLSKIYSMPVGVERTTQFEFRLLAMGLTIGLLLMGWRTLKAKYQIYAWLNVALFMFTKAAISVPRYSFLIFPLIFICVHKLEDEFHYMLLLASCAFLMSLHFVAYHMGGWGF